IRPVLPHQILHRQIRSERRQNSYQRQYKYQISPSQVHWKWFAAGVWHLEYFSENLQATNDVTQDQSNHNSFGSDKKSFVEKDAENKSFVGTKTLHGLDIGFLFDEKHRERRNKIERCHDEDKNQDANDNK